MEEWKEYKLNEVCGLVPGFAFKSKDFGTGADVAIKIKDIQPPYVETKDADHVDISNYDLKKLSKFIVHRGEFLLAMTGATIGKIGKYIDEKPAYVNQRVLRFKDVGLIDYQYLYYFLSTEVFQSYIFNHIDSQSAQPNISSNTIGRYTIRVPSLRTQQQIAAILSSLDDRIECNRLLNDNLALSFLLLICFVLWLLKQINDNLEHQARTLFKSWFVDFEPFMDGEFVESEMGMIPKGWSIQKAQDVFEINIGKTPPRKEKEWFTESTDDNIWVSIADMGSCGVFISDSSEYLTIEAIRKYNILMVEKDSVLLSFKLTIGRVAIADTKLTTNEAIARFILPDKSYREFLYLYLKRYEYGSLGSTSSIATAVNSKTIKGMKLLMPNVDIIKEFSHKARPLFEQIRINQQESRRLAQLRDTLLPRLMSGELKVNEIERTVG